MRHGNELDVEWPDIETAAKRNDFHGDFRRAGLARAFCVEQCGRERRGIDRQLQPRPQVEQRAEMILMRMGEHQAGEVLALLHEIANVGQNQIDAGQMFLCRKRHAEVDSKPVRRRSSPMP